MASTSFWPIPETSSLAHTGVAINGESPKCTMSLIMKTPKEEPPFMETAIWIISLFKGI